MSKPKVIVAGIEREMTDAEYVVYLRDQENHKIRKAAEQYAAEKKQAILNRLGLDEEEIKILLNG